MSATRPQIYLDNNATTYMDPLVSQRLQALYAEGVANPASQHRPGRMALSLLEDAKSDILRFTGAPDHGMHAAQVTMTSGGTEANNLIIAGSLQQHPGQVIVGATDHPSVLEAARLVDPSGQRLSVLPVDSLGRCDLDQFSERLERMYAQADERVALVSIMLGNNETGIVQDLPAIVQICNRYDIPVHSDVVQAIGKMPFNMADIGLSAITITGHKIHGPVGVGALITLPNVKFAPLLIGGGQQLGLRAGTEAVIPAVGLATALQQICTAQVAGEFEQVGVLRDRFESSISAAGDVQIIGQSANRLPHTSNIAFLGVDRQAFHMSLDLAGLACSTGSACASGSSRPSGVLVAMDLPEATIRGSLRFSLSRFTTAHDIDQAIRIVSQAMTKHQQSS